MRFASVGLSIGGLLLLGSVARTEVRNYVVSDAEGGPKCLQDDSFPEADVGKLRIHVEFPEAATPTAGDVTVSAGRLEVAPEFKDNVATATLEAAKYKPDLDVVVKARFKGRDLSCGHFKTAGSQAAPVSRALSASDVDAQIWLTANKEKLRNMADRGTVLLPHLPSGQIAAPYPASVSERDRLQVVLVLDRRLATGGALSIDACPERDSFRILGDFSALGKLQGARIAPEHFALVPIGAEFECGAGKVVYTAAQASPAGEDTPPAPPSTTLRVRPVYQLAATFIWAFDMQSQSTFSARDQKVVRQRDRIGSTLNVGFTWFPGGVDYEHMRARNHWLNPFLVFDLKGPQENFASGLAFTASGGLSLAVGVSFHKSTVLDGKTEGDAFTGDGAVPTRRVWDRDSVGFFVGVALDSTTFSKAKALWGATSR